MGARVVTWDINSAGNQETVEMLKAKGYEGFAFTVNMANKWVMWSNLSYWSICFHVNYDHLNENFLLRDENFLIIW